MTGPARDHPATVLIAEEMHPIRGALAALVS